MTGRPETPPRGRPALISVVLPVRNGEPHLAEQLASLAAQRYAGDWEVLVVDNGCTDRSMETVESWRARLPELRVVDARDRRGLNRARNAGAAAARGDFLAFCDADDVTVPEWLELLAVAGATADIVGGPVDSEALNEGRPKQWNPTEPITRLSSSYGFLPYAPGGNCGIWADVARAVSWDESFGFGASDIDFAWRAQLAGYRAAFAPGALIRRRYRTSLRSTAKQYFRYGVSEPHLFRLYRRHGMTRDAQALDTWRWLARSGHLLLTDTGRGRWVRVAASKCGRTCGSLRWRVVYL